MLEILKAILYGIVEGVTEWLPISSTGHLILLEQMVPMNVSDEFMSMFDVVIQLGAILAVVVLFFGKLWPFSPDREKSKGAWILWGKVVAAVIPSAVAGFLLDDWMDEHLYNAWVVALMLIIYGIAFILVERQNRGGKHLVSTVENLSIQDALMIGAFQCLALIPGTSRSGATILGGILLGVSRPAAAEFSFFLAIPTMVGASGLKMVKFLVNGGGFTGQEAAILAVASLVSFLVSLAVIRGLMDYVRRHSFAAFGVYRIVLGGLVLVYFLVVR